MAKWIETRIGADFMTLSKQLNIDPVAARVLRNRGLENAADMGRFLKNSEDMYHDPYLFDDMDKAIKLILDIIDRRERIRIIGDYDVDGITSTYILLKGLETIGVDVDYAIPDRIQDGYGLNRSLIDNAIVDKISLVITCDNGIAAQSEIDYAMESRKPIVFDADAIKLIVKGDDFSHMAVLTPHLGEYRTLCRNLGVEDGDFMDKGRRVSEMLNAVIVIKTSVVWIFYKEKAFVYDGSNPSLLHMPKSPR